MRLRSAASLSALAVIVALGGCADEGYEITDLSTRLVIEPLFAGEIPGEPVQFSASIGGVPVAVTWESSDPDIATVSPTGLATGVDYGFVGITATLTSDPSRRKSASFSVKPPGLTLSSGVDATGIEGEVGDLILYHINVPDASAQLVFQMSGGTGDLDLYVRPGEPPTYVDWACRPYAAGNNEVCTFPDVVEGHPAPVGGWWFAMIDVYQDGGGVTLRATVTAP